MELASPSELRDRTRTRDAQDVRTYEVRFSDPAAFLDDLEADARKGAIEDGIVRLAIVNGRANQGQVDLAFGDDDGPFSPGADRHNLLYRSKFFHCSYLARGQLVQLSIFCGLALRDGVAERYAEAGQGITAATALALIEAASTVQRRVQMLEDVCDLDVRGGAMFVEDGPAWRSDPEHVIETIPEDRCATCKAPIYYKNGDWRHRSTGRTDVLETTINRRGRPAKKLHHMAHPTIEGRQI